MKSRKLCLLFGLGLIFCLSACAGWAQDEEKKKDEKKKEIPKPEKLTLKTKDNVNLVCNYFGSTNEKEAVPVILLHDLEGSKEEFTPFAIYLQNSFGCAVIVPDLRGHGESTKTVTNEVIDVSKFKKADYALFNEDISTCFRYLRDEVNNKGECNIDMLCVLGTGYVGINAMAWTLVDYSYQPLRGKKQGQFVKGLVLLSPRKSIKGYSATQILKDPLFTGRGATPVPVLIAAGNGDEKSYRDAKSIHRTLERTRPNHDDIPDAAERFKKMSLWFGDYEGSAGAAMLDPRNRTKLEIFIARFIQYKIVAVAEELPWVNYKKKE